MYMYIYTYVYDSGRLPVLLSTESREFDLCLKYIPKGRVP